MLEEMIHRDSNVPEPAVMQLSAGDGQYDPQPDCKNVTAQQLQRHGRLEWCKQALHGTLVTSSPYIPWV